MLFDYLEKIMDEIWMELAAIQQIVGSIFACKEWFNK
jgi:hypothetical protein